MDNNVMSAIIYMKVCSSDLHYFTYLHYDFVAIYTFNYYCICRKEERPPKKQDFIIYLFEQLYIKINESKRNMEALICILLANSAYRKQLNDFRSCFFG